MNVLHFSRRYLVALLTIVGALTMLIYSTAHASDTNPDHSHHETELQSLVNVSLSTTVNIDILGNGFSPNNIQIPAIGVITVTWTNRDSVAHTTRAIFGLWDSGVLAPGQSFSTQLYGEGAYNYRCEIHTSMTGTIDLVQPSPTPTATVTPVPPGATRPDTIGVYKDGVFYLRNSNTGGIADITVAFGVTSRICPLLAIGMEMAWIQLGFTEVVLESSF
jgi:plastocyanin